MQRKTMFCMMLNFFSTLFCKKNHGHLTCFYAMKCPAVASLNFQNVIKTLFDVLLQFQQREPKTNFVIFITLHLSV